MVRNAYRSKVETYELEVRRLKEALEEKAGQVLHLEAKVASLEKDSLTYRQRINTLSQENESF